MCAWDGGGCHWPSDGTPIVSHTETSKDRGHVIVAGDNSPGAMGRAEFGFTMGLASAPSSQAEMKV